jgi:5-methylcytosine-specific restriction endonuclease McrA
LAEHPFCVVCGAKASHVDHILNRAEGGGDLDPGNLQSMCAKHHHARTVEESHRDNKRAAERRRRGR